MPGIISEITNAFSQCPVPPMSAPCLLPLRYNYYSIPQPLAAIKL